MYKRHAAYDCQGAEVCAAPHMRSRRHNLFAVYVEWRTVSCNWLLAHIFYATYLNLFTFFFFEHWAHRYLRAHSSVGMHERSFARFALNTRLWSRIDAAQALFEQLHLICCGIQYTCISVSVCVSVSVALACATASAQMSWLRWRWTACWIV